MYVDWEYYKIFYYVAKYQNFTKAARVLGNNQPNITHSMNRLESQLNCVLFIRSNRGVTLTPEGELLYSRIASAAVQIQDAEEELSASATLEHGAISISATETALNIYLAEKLRTLSGKKLQSKRNLVNRFKTAYEGRWSYEDMTPENVKDAFGYHIRWCNQNGCAQNRDFQGETCAIVQALHNFSALALKGGLLRLDGEVIAFTFGCRATPDMYVVQIEKADHTIPGAYQMINQQFVLRNCDDVEYVNREEDLGIEGLRKAKKSYYPVMRGVKYTAVPKERAE